MQVVKETEKMRAIKKQARASGQEIPDGEIDAMFAQLLNSYHETFLTVSDAELSTLDQRTIEYKILARKSVYISYMFFNLNKVDKMADIMNVYSMFVEEKNRSAEIFKELNSYGNGRNEAIERISDFDKLAGEILGVLATIHLCNIVQKYSHDEEICRIDAFNSARLMVSFVYQAINEKKIYWKQLEYFLNEIAKVSQKNASTGIDIEIAKGYQVLKNKFTKKQLPENEIFLLNN